MALQAAAEPFRPRGRTLVFFHVLVVNHVLQVVKTQCDALYGSGLYNSADTIYVTLSSSAILDTDSGTQVRSTPELRAKVRLFFRGQGAKFQVVETTDPSAFERATLHSMPALVEDDDRVLYIHSKGVAHTAAAAAVKRNLWVDFMLHWTVDRYQACLDALDHHDTIGVMFQREPEPHYAGNFWWATGRHIRSLPLPIGDHYRDPEMWVCKGADAGEIPLPFTATPENVPHRKDYIDL